MRNDRLAEVFVEYLWKLLGHQYVWGGDDPVGGFDCSGLMGEGLQAVGRMKDGTRRNANWMYHEFEKADVPLPGMLACFGKDDKATHIGCVVGAVEGLVLMIEAGGGGPTTKSEASAIRQNAFVKPRPVSRRDDLLGYVDPFAIKEA